jgi:DNA-binding transcriptional MerR regulator
VSDAVQYSEQDNATLLSVGAAAGRLGVAPATVRSWERRYGLAPGGRSSGGHRRYTEADLGRLHLMQELVSRGQTPAAAARAVLAGNPEHSSVTTRPAVPQQDSRPRPTNRGGGPGGRVLAVPGASPEVRGLARAASRLDADAATGQLGDLLVDRGAVRTWDEVLRPVLASIGERWVRAGVDVEHVLSEAVMDALRSYRAFLPRPVPGPPVLLAGAPEEQHTLPLHVLAAALAELRIPLRLLGGRVPTSALLAAARRTGAASIFLWRHNGAGHAAAEPGSPAEPSEPSELAELAELARLTHRRPARLLVVGGAGWHAARPPGARYALDLASAVALLRPTTR